MAYLMENDLTEEFRRLFQEAFPDADPSKVHIYDRDNERPRHPFTACIDGKEVKFTVPEDDLHSAPLRYVSSRYLEPLLRRMTAGDKP